MNSAGNVRALRPNRHLSFCPGAIVDGKPQPFVIGAGTIPTHLCQNLLLSIANPRVYHTVLHSRSDSHQEFCLRTFPKSVLQQLATAQGIQWLSPCTLPLRLPSGDTPEATLARTSIPKNLTIRFGAHRASVYGSSAAAKTAPFATAAKDLVSESHVRDYIHKPIQPKILDEKFSDYQKLIDDMEVDPTPVTLACLPSMTVAPSSSE